MTLTMYAVYATGTAGVEFWVSPLIMAESVEEAIVVAKRKKCEQWRNWRAEVVPESKHPPQRERKDLA
jgi:hypothetical protein